MSSFYVPVEGLLQSRAFRRLLAWSLAGHVAVFLALVIHPFRRTELISTSPVMVQMVSMPKAAAPKPAPAKPAPPPKEQPKPPEPPPAPPKPVVKEIVIPKEPQPLAKPKPAPKPVTPPPSAEELLAKMTERVEAQEATKAPPQTEEASSDAPAATESSPGRFDPVLSPWLARVKAVVRGNWAGASVCRGVAQFDVDIDAGGQLTHVELAQSSGDSYCDGTGERALRKSNPLPPPPYALSFVFVLDPKETQ